MAEFVPLLMGDKIIGKICIDHDGSFIGNIEEEGAHILAEGMNGPVKCVVLQSIYGMAAHQDMSAQEKWAAYLRTPTQTTPEYRTVYGMLGSQLTVHNLPSEEAAKKKAKEMHNQTGGSYSWRKQAHKYD